MSVRSFKFLFALLVLLFALAQPRALWACPT
jgi:hypothetical protein